MIGRQGFCSVDKLMGTLCVSLHSANARQRGVSIHIVGSLINDVFEFAFGLIKAFQCDQAECRVQTGVYVFRICGEQRFEHSKSLVETSGEPRFHALRIQAAKVRLNRRRHGRNRLVEKHQFDHESITTLRPACSHVAAHARRSSVSRKNSVPSFMIACPPRWIQV